MVGDPAHRVAIFVRLDAGGLFFIARCGISGIAHDEPRLLGVDGFPCVMCYSDESFEAAA